MQKIRKEIDEAEKIVRDILYLYNILLLGQELRPII
jgi:hypothetical protein